MLSLCAASCIAFFDRALLAHTSIEAMEGFVTAYVLAVLFQSSLMRLATIGQAFVGQQLPLGSVSKNRLI